IEPRPGSPIHGRKRQRTTDVHCRVVAVSQQNAFRLRFGFAAGCEAGQCPSVEVAFRFVGYALGAALA
ncbi:MAG: hypothetical protein ABR568_23685, partial [Pyrinomonadaceae bacterium]